MRPLAALDAVERGRIVGLFFDLDDTLLTHGLLERAAFDALWDLHDAGLRLVAVTGRPSGWAEVFARQWPIDGAVTENGAVFVVREGKGVRVEGADRRDPRLDALAAAAAAAFPDIALADDVHARRADITWDVGERAAIPDERIRALTGFIVAAGARTTRSSVHVHATFAPDDKASGALRFVQRRFGDDPGSARFRWAFAGDSGNDAACFAAFWTTFGVANVRPWIGRLTVPPRYVAPSECGRGFAEIAGALLSRL